MARRTKLNYRYEIVDPLANREVERSKHWLLLAPCRDAGEERAREIMGDRGWPVVWLIVKSKSSGDTLRHYSLFAAGGRARNQHLEHAR